MKKQSKLKTKLNLVSVGTMPKTSDKVEVLSISPTKAKSKTTKAKTIQCYIYLGRLKSNPKILITQIRFEAFQSVKECEEWCKEHCSAYEIRDHKSGLTIIKK